MNFWHPLERIPDGWPTVVAFFVLLGCFFFTASRTKAKDILETKAAPNRAISLEFAGSEKRAREIVNSWGSEAAKAEAYRHLRWDNLFIIFYSTLIALGCVMGARVLLKSYEPLYGIALFVAWLPWVAGLLDYVENEAMYVMVGGFSGEALPRVGWLSAALKFVILIPVASYALVGAAAYFLRMLYDLFKAA